MTVQKCWMYGITKKSKEETTLSGEALKEHSRIVHECSEFMTVWKDVFDGAFNRAFTELMRIKPDVGKSLTLSPASLSGRPLNGNHVRQVAQRLWQRNSSVKTSSP